MGPVQGERFAGMPQLPQRRFHGHHKTVAAGFGGASALPVHGREDLHRLPQGHRPPPARHARRARLAIAENPPRPLVDSRGMCLSAEFIGSKFVEAAPHLTLPERALLVSPRKNGEREQTEAISLIYLNEPLGSPGP